MAVAQPVGERAIWAHADTTNGRSVAQARVGQERGEVIHSTLAALVGTGAETGALPTSAGARTADPDRDRCELQACMHARRGKTVPVGIRVGGVGTCCYTDTINSLLANAIAVAVARRRTLGHPAN